MPWLLRRRTFGCSVWCQAGAPQTGPANTAAINAAMTAFTGKPARLVLPACDVYVDQANTSDNWPIKLIRQRQASRELHMVGAAW